MTVMFGWWALPLAVTLVSMSWWVFTPSEQCGDYSFDLMPLFRAATAIIASLIAWLIWALLT